MALYWHFLSLQIPLFHSLFLIVSIPHYCHFDNCFILPLSWIWDSTNSKLVCLLVLRFLLNITCIGDKPIPSSELFLYSNILYHNFPVITNFFKFLKFFFVFLLKWLNSISSSIFYIVLFSSKLSKPAFNLLLILLGILLRDLTTGITPFNVILYLNGRLPKPSNMSLYFCKNSYFSLVAISTNLLFFFFFMTINKTINIYCSFYI